MSQYKQVFELLCNGKTPPFTGDPRKLNSSDFLMLQDWVSFNTSLEWATGVGIIESVIDIVDKRHEGFTL